MDNADIERKALTREVFMKHGFTIKEGQTDLKDYVYAAANELLARASMSAPVPDSFDCSNLASDGWVKCSDRLPEKGTLVLPYIELNGIKLVSHEASLFSGTFRFWRENDYGAFDWFVQKDHIITHWMPLPNPPTMDTQP